MDFRSSSVLAANAITVHSKTVDILAGKTPTPEVVELFNEFLQEGVTRRRHEKAGFGDDGTLRVMPASKPGEKRQPVFTRWGKPP
ncbi:MAG: hypothetical protein LBT97_07460 [Planctomycetota bacterium]|jgi:hypothetical protein|nr:hypothetical protein [Planctomycetota bacterium]